MGSETVLAASQNAALAARLREEIARRRMSRENLAAAARISISTLEKALNGSRPFTTASIVRLEAALGINLRPGFPESPSRSDLGGYARAGVSWLEGDYLTLRPSFEVISAIYAYRTKIIWADDSACLTFQEADRLDAPFSQKGVVSMPNKSGYIYLYTNDHGQMRLAVLGRPQISGDMYGLLTTLAAGSGNNLTPVSSPIALLPMANHTNPIWGRVQKSDAAYLSYKKHFDTILKQGHAKLLSDF